MNLIPKAFPRMAAPPVHVSSLAWYAPGTPGLEKMGYDARSDYVDLSYLDPDQMLIGVPRTLAPEPTTPEQDRRVVGSFEFEAEFTSTLRPEQEPFVDGVFQMLEDELGGIGEAPTGFGKTITGCALACRIGRPTCVVIPKGDLDWKGALLQHTNIPENKIDYWQGQRLPNPDAWVTVAMLQSIYRDGIYPQEVYDRFACVIFDEVHRLGSEEFGKAIRKFPAMWRLGLSATADRRDGKMDYIHAHIGWRHVVGHTDAAQPDYFIIETDWMEPINKSTGKRMAYNPARTDMTKRSLMADPIRNARIAAAAYRAYAAGRRTIIFVEQVKHMNRLRDAILSMGVPLHLVNRYGGDATAEEMARCKECPEGLVMIATYKYTAEGTDIPPLDTAIYAHPIYDPRQSKGRITRKHPGKPKPVVIDVVDPLSGPLKSIAKARWEFLRKDGARYRGHWPEVG